MHANVYTTLLAAACGLLLLQSCIASDSQEQFKASKLGSPITCVKQKTPIDCDLLDECVWCAKEGTSWGTGCYPMAAAKLLPKKFGIECDKDLDPSAAASTTSTASASTTATTSTTTAYTAAASGLLPGAVRQSVCDGKPQAACAAPDCVWCTSAAVGGGCYTPAEAKLLPKAIFKCNSPTLLTGSA